MCIRDRVKTVNNEVVNNNPTIYLYNSHDTEEYKPTSFAEYSVMPLSLIHI